MAKPTIMAALLTEAAQNSKLTASERRKITGSLGRYKELDGNIKVPSLGEAINKLAAALDEAGFTLEMVSGDILLGDRGNRRLPFMRKPPTGSDAFTEGPRVEGCFINFTWENISREGRSYEVIAYLT